MVSKKKKQARKNKHWPGEKKKRPGFLKRLSPLIKSVGYLLFACALNLACVLGYDILTQSSYFKARQIDLKGHLVLGSGELLKQAEIKTGMNLLKINLGAVRKKLLAHPWVEEADVMRTLPDLLSIRIYEQKPCAIIDLGGASRFLLNSKGVIFSEYRTSDPKVGKKHLPLVSGLTIHDVREYGRGENIHLKSVLTLLRMGEPDAAVVPTSRIRSITVDKDIGISLSLLGGNIKTVNLGYHHFKTQFERLRRVTRRLKTMDLEKYKLIEFINLNHMDKVVVKAAYNIPKEV